MQPVILHRYGIWGQALTLYFATQDVTDTDDLYQGAGWAAGDAKISIDGGAEASTTNTPVRITAFIHKLDLTAAEMQGRTIAIAIRDQTEPEVFQPVFAVVETALWVEHIKCDGRNNNVAAMTLLSGGAFAGIDITCETGHGISIVAGAGANGIDVRGTHGINSFSTGNGDGIHAAGANGGHGVHALGGAAGAGIVGAGAAAAVSSTAGIVGTGGSGAAGVQGVGGNNADGILGSGTGTGSGVRAAAGATGHGFHGSATAGNGALLAAGGAFAGLKATGASNKSGIEAVGQGTGHGIEATSGSGATGNGIHATAASTNGHGFYAKGTGTGYGIAGDGASANQYTNIFQTTEGTEPAGAIANNATFAAILQHLKRRFLNKVTATASVLTVFKDDSATTLFTKNLSNDGTTVTQLKAA